MTTPSEMASGATHSNSAPADSGQPGEAPADSGQPGESEQRARREFFDTFMAAGKSVFEGISRDDLLDRWTRLYFDGQLQRANIAHMKEEQELKDAAQAKELELKDAAQAKELELKDAELRANNLKWQAAVQAETTADKIRSLVLIAVVLALVATPLVAMPLHIPTAAYSQYIAPIVAIAGTVIGYWFGQKDRVRVPQPAEDADHRNGTADTMKASQSTTT